MNRSAFSGLGPLITKETAGHLKSLLFQFYKYTYVFDSAVYTIDAAISVILFSLQCN